MYTVHTTYVLHTYLYCVELGTVGGNGSIVLRWLDDFEKAGEVAVGESLNLCHLPAQPAAKVMDSFRKFVLVHARNTHKIF